MLAAGVGVVAELARQQVRDRAVGLAGHAAVKANSGLGQRLLRPAADAAADQRVRAQLPQQRRQRAVAAAGRIDRARGDDLAVRDLIEPELLRVSEMLEHLSVFISYRNGHGCTPSVGRLSVVIFRSPPAAAPARAIGRRAAAELIVPARDQQLAAAHQAFRQLAPRRAVDRLRGGARHLHLGGALLLRHALQIDQADALELVEGHDDPPAPAAAARPKAPAAGHGADAPPLARSRHVSLPLCFRHMPTIA